MQSEYSIELIKERRVWIRRKPVQYGFISRKDYLNMHGSPAHNFIFAGHRDQVGNSRPDLVSGLYLP